MPRSTADEHPMPCKDDQACEGKFAGRTGHPAASSTSWTGSIAMSSAMSVKHIDDRKYECRGREAAQDGAAISWRRWHAHQKLMLDHLVDRLRNRLYSRLPQARPRDGQEAPL